MRIHFMGVGKMGLPMARHLSAAGHSLSVNDPDPACTQLAMAQGLPIAQDLAQAIAQSDVIFSSLPNDAALCAVAAQVAAAAPPGAIYVDTSTVSQQASAQAAQACEAAGLRCLRATVSGNNRMAEAAQLTVMASGPRAAFDEVLPLLQALGPHQFYLGPAEQARLMKLVVNLMIAQTSAMLAEALTLGRKGGLDWNDMWQVLGASAQRERSRSRALRLARKTQEEATQNTLHWDAMQARIAEHAPGQWLRMALPSGQIGRAHV